MITIYNEHFQTIESHIQFKPFPMFTLNQEYEIKGLLKYCNLEWDENCLNFHNNDRVVQTISSSQVRQKMYQGSSEAWKQYKDYLSPLKEDLNS